MPWHACGGNMEGEHRCHGMYVEVTGSFMKLSIIFHFYVG